MSWLRLTDEEEVDCRGASAKYRPIGKEQRTRLKTESDTYLHFMAKTFLNL